MMASTGQKERASSKRGQLRRPNLSRFYNQRLADLHPGMFDFRVLLVRPALPEKDRVAAFDRKTTYVEWNDESDTPSATVTLRRPFRLKPGSVPVKRGDGIRLEFRWANKWRELWTLWVQGEPEVNLASGEVTCELGDLLFPLKKNERDWEFRKTKRGARRKGWTADEITRYVGHKERVRIGKLAEGTKRFELKKMKKASGLEVIKRAYAHETKRTGRKFIVRMRNGAVEVLPLRRPGTIYIIKGVEKESSIAGNPKQAHPATVIEAKGRLKGAKGKDSKLEVTVSREAAVRRFGRVVKEKDYGRVDSEGDLREQAKRDLAGELKVIRSATLTLPGIPFLEKGSALKWIIGEPGWSGQTKLAKHPLDKAFVYVTGAQHSLTPETYSTVIQVNQDDIYFDDAKKRDEEDRNDKHQQRQGRRQKQGK